MSTESNLVQAQQLQKEEDIEFNINIRVRAKGSLKSNMDGSPTHEQQQQFEQKQHNGISSASISKEMASNVADGGSIEVSEYDSPNNVESGSALCKRDSKYVINLQVSLNNNNSSSNAKSQANTPRHTTFSTKSSCKSLSEEDNHKEQQTQTQETRVDWATIQPTQADQCRERRKRTFTNRASRMLNRLSTRLGFGGNAWGSGDKQVYNSTSPSELLASYSAPAMSKAMNRKSRAFGETLTVTNGSVALNSSNLANLMEMIQKEEQQQQQLNHYGSPNQPLAFSWKNGSNLHIRPLSISTSIEHNHRRNSSTSVAVSTNSALSLPDENDRGEIVHASTLQQETLGGNVGRVVVDESTGERRASGFGAKLKNLISSWKADKQAKKDEKELQKLVNTMYNILGYISSKPVWLEEEGLFRKNGVKNDVKALVKTIHQFQAPGNPLTSPQASKSKSPPITTLSTRMDVHTVLGSLKKMCMDIMAERENRSSGTTTPPIPRLLDDFWEHWYEQLSYNKKELFETTILLLSLIHSERYVNKMDAVAISRGAPCLAFSVLTQGCGVLLQGLPEIRFSKTGNETTPGTKDKVTMVFDRKQHNAKLGKQKWIDMVERTLRFKLVSESQAEGADQSNLISLVFHSDK